MGQIYKLICLSDEESTLGRAIRKSNSKVSVALTELVVIKQRKAKRRTLSNALSVLFTYLPITHTAQIWCAQ